MLCLSRKRGERIEIAGGSIIVQIVDIRGDVVRLGITAPDGITIDREEVADRKRRDGPQRPQAVV
jgi:carbon storage regulator